MKNSKQCALGIDCGGTNMKLALVNHDGRVLKSKRVKMDYSPAPEKVIQKMAGDIHLMMPKSKPIEGIGIGIAGDVDQTIGMVRFSPNLGWRNIALKELLEKHLKSKVFIDNDANCAALGAYALDAKRDCKNLICLTLGTGIGGGIIINSALYRGSTGSAGELGHMTVRYDGRPCKCGSFGCAESYVGAWGIIQSAQEGVKKGAAPILSKILERKKGAILSPELISLAAQKGDPYCIQLWRDSGEQLGALLASCVNAFNPDRIVLCGGVSKAGDLLLLPALHSLGRRAFAVPARKAQVTVSKFDEWLGVVGAALLLWEKDKPE